MATFNEKNQIIGSSEYNTAFWNVMRGGRYAVDKLQDVKDVSTGGFALPSGSSDKLTKAIRRESLFRNMATTVKAYNGSSRIFAKDCDDLAQWVPKNGNIPIFDGVNDFTRYAVDAHKLAVFVKLDDDFIHDTTFSIEDYLTDRLELCQSRGLRFYHRHRKPYAHRHPGRGRRCTGRCDSKRYYL